MVPDSELFSIVRVALHAGLADIMEGDTRRHLEAAVEATKKLEQRLRQTTHELVRLRRGAT